MAEPYVSEIRIISFPYPPRGWGLCGRQLLLINQSQVLFSLLGTNYGGNGRTNFALPDFRNRAPGMQGNGYTVGRSGGAAVHKLSTAELPKHTHPAMGSSTNADAPTADGAVLGAANNVYTAAT